MEVVHNCDDSWKDQGGLPTNVYTVVIEENGRVVTMHPGLPN